MKETIVNPTDTKSKTYREARLQRLAAIARENIDRSNEEFSQRKTILNSTPQTIFVQINAACNANCIFCSKGFDYEIFHLDDWLKKYGDEITPVLAKARQVILTGSGELLGLPDSEKILTYFNTEFPHVEKFIATNGSYLTPRVVDLICQSGSKYTLQMSLHASHADLHRQMLRFGAYERVKANLQNLMKSRDKKLVDVTFMFILTTLNIEDLPDFVKWAAQMGADRVQCGYFYIYESNQKYLSLYFKQDLANKMIDEATRIAHALGISFQAPPKFGQTPGEYKKPDCCLEPWFQLMLSLDGYILPCDVYGNFPREENLNDRTFMEIWNGPTYRKIRESIAKQEGCIAHCPRHNPSSVNDWNSHVIHRTKEDRLIVKEYNESLREA